MKKIFFTLLIYSFLHVNNAYSEIQEVTVRWNNVTCNLACQNLLLNKFKTIPGVADVKMNGSIGAATLVYSQGQPFNYQPIRYAFHAIGPYMQDIRAKVRGYVSTTPDQSKFMITSIGDGTIMQVVSPPQFNSTNMTNYKSIYAYGIDQGLKDRLLEAIQKNLPVIVEGPLFEIYRYDNPPYLIVNTLKIDDSKQK